MSAQSAQSARQRRILENSQKRLEKLKRLKQIEAEVLNANEQSTDFKKDLLPKEDDAAPISTQTLANTETIEDKGPKKIENKESMKIEKLPSETGENKSDAGGDEDAVEDYSSSSQRHNPPFPNQTVTSTMKTNTQHSTPLFDAEQQHEERVSYLAKRYRFILFILLAWVVFLVVEKDFDWIFAYIIRQELPKENLPYIVWTSFISVEVQVILLSMFVTQKNESPSGVAMLPLLLNILKIPGWCTQLLIKVTAIVSTILKDFCTYFFVLVMLRYLNTMTS